MSNALVIRHVSFEDLGSFGPALRAKGCFYTYRDAVLDDLDSRDLLDTDLLIVLGGPIGVYEDRVYPFLRPEIRLIERRLKAGRPVLGICLGAQLIARALGARVYHGRHKELGWSKMSLTEAGQRSALRVLGNRSVVLHWHGDSFDLPRGAELLASTDLYENQAFSFGSALALQFHVEATARSLEQWFVGYSAELAGTKGISVVELRRTTRRTAGKLQLKAPELLKSWMESVGL